MSLIERAKGILMSPSKEWARIEKESKSTGALYAGYVVPLAAIGPVASIVAMSVIGVTIPLTGSSIRVPMEHAVSQGLVSYVLTLGGVFVLALIINTLAPNFGGTRDNSQALKVAIYSSTAAWLASVFVLIQAVSVLSLLGLYSIYLLYTGLPVLMKSPKEKSMGYTVVVIICAFVLFTAAGYVAGSVVPGSLQNGSSGAQSFGKARPGVDQMSDEERARVSMEALIQLRKANQNRKGDSE